jgi:hypothetical protein
MVHSSRSAKWLCFGRKLRFLQAAPQTLGFVSTALMNAGVVVPSQSTKRQVRGCRGCGETIVATQTEHEEKQGTNSCLITTHAMAPVSVSTYETSAIIAFSSIVTPTHVNVPLGDNKGRLHWQDGERSVGTCRVE